VRSLALLPRGRSSAVTRRTSQIRRAGRVDEPAQAGRKLRVRIGAPVDDEQVSPARSDLQAHPVGDFLPRERPPSRAGGIAHRVYLAGEIAPTCRRYAARWAEREREERCTASDQTAPRDGSRLTAYPRSRRSPGPEAYEDDRPDAVSPPTEPSVPARLATSSGSGASRRRTASASCAGESPVRAAFARSRSSRFSRRRCLADCFSPNKVSRLEVDPQLNRPDRRNSRSS
jgi:hypothetical protein